MCSLEVSHIPKTQTHGLCATSGASDYAVRPNKFPVLGLMDAIIFMDLKQVNVPPITTTSTPTGHTHAHTLQSVVLEPLRRYGSVKKVKLYCDIFNLAKKTFK